MNDLLSRTNQNGTVLPGQDFPPYIDLSNPFGKRPSVTAINDTYYHQKWGESREINRTSTTWIIHNSTSGSTGTITFTDCNMTNYSRDFIQCPHDPPTYYRQLNGNLYRGIWTLLYPIEKTPNQILELCSFGCDNLVVQQSNSLHFQLLDSHNDRLSLSEPVTTKGTNQTISFYQGNRLLGENREIRNATEIDSNGAKQALVGNHHKALFLYQKVLRIDPWNTYALTGIAIELYHFKNYTGAIEYSNKSLATFPIDPTPTYVKGLTLYQLGDYIESLKNYREIFNMNPNYPGLLNNIGLDLYHIGDDKDALTAYDTALLVNSTDYYTFYDRALVFDKLGDKHQALEDVNKAIEINPNDTFALDLKASLSREGVK